MFRNTPLANTPTLKLALGFGLCGLSGALLYIYFKYRDDEDEDVVQQSNSNSQQIKPKGKEFTLKVEVLNKHVPLIIGRGGANVKSIEEKTRTKIRFRDKDAEHTYCDITGYPDAVKASASLINKVIESAPIVKEEIFVPTSVYGQITGRCGEAMQEICRASMAKVEVDAAGARNIGGIEKRRIVISGNQQQVNIARKLIEDKIAEDESLKSAVEAVEQQREPRRSPTNSVTSSLYSSQTSLSLAPRDKILNARSDEKPMEVYVSAVACPSKFWLQIVGPQSKKLDDLVQTMTAYYKDKENQAKHKIREPYLGQIVAAMFKLDEKFYRAEIVGIMPNSFNENQVVFDLYFVDYGDSEYVGTHEVFELRPDFFSLRFQAVECFLANVKPTQDANNESFVWDPEAITLFEDLTQVAQWKKLVARIVTYKERSPVGDGDRIREGTSIPGVELIDVTEDGEINIGMTLIEQGYGFPNDGNPSVYANGTNSSTPSSEMTLSQTSLSPTPSEKSLSMDNNNSSLLTSDTTADALIDQQLKHLKSNGSERTNESSSINKTAINNLIAAEMNGNGNTISLNGIEKATNGKISLSK